MMLKSDDAEIPVTDFLLHTRQTIHIWAGQIIMYWRYRPREDLIYVGWNSPSGVNDGMKS